MYIAIYIQFTCKCFNTGCSAAQYTGYVAIPIVKSSLSLLNNTGTKQDDKQQGGVIVQVPCKKGTNLNNACATTAI